MMISCPEEIAYRLGFIDKESLIEQANMINNQYGAYLLRLAEEEIPFHSS
jgi:glucose-1-phosphate thymidylyltransferase